MTIVKRSRGVRLAAVSTAALALAGGILIWADPDPAVRAAGRPGCGTDGVANVAAIQAEVAGRIYADELHGRETAADTARVRAYRPLAEALAASDPTAAHRAVHALVYAPHWHIVRLRVIRAGRVLADVGGPHVLAPVSGALRFHGRVVGRYVMSVQDDLGYQKLITRFIGAPLEIYRHGAPLIGTVAAVPASPPVDGSSLTLAGRSYLVRLLSARAFPAGGLSVALFVPSAGTSAPGCAAVRLAAWGSIARHLAARFDPLSTHLQSLADVIRAVTRGRALVRSGSRRLLGGGPARIPSSGLLEYGGRHWPVYSWAPAPNLRIYFLTPRG